MPGSNDVTTRAGPIARGANLAWVAEALVERREEILARWADVTARQPFHLGRRANAVADHIPSLFDAIVALLQRTAPRAVLSDSPLEDPSVLREASEHARVRFEQGLSGGDVVTEFRLLRQEVGRAIRAEVDDDAPTGDVVAAEMLVHDALDGAIALALTGLSQHLEEMREEFLATTIHDVKQPITTIRASAQVGLRQLGHPDADLASVTACLRRVMAECDRMSLLVGTLVDASRLRLGRLEPKFLHADLGVLLDQHLERLEPEAADRVHVETPPDADLTGRWDPDQLDRVIANLVSNALKYSSPPEPIEVSFASGLDTVTLSVTDHGVGIARDDLLRVFSRYGRADNAVIAGIEGHGLGLFLCKGIVEAHGGRIWAESPGAGQGTSVILALPREPEPPVAE